MEKTSEVKSKFQYFLEHLSLEEKQAFWALLHTTTIVNMSKKALIGKSEI